MQANKREMATQNVCKELERMNTIHTASMYKRIKRNNRTKPVFIDRMHKVKSGNAVTNRKHINRY